MAERSVNDAMDDLCDDLNTVYEKKSNKVTSISSSSTHTQYVSAKAVYDYVGTLDDWLIS